MDQVQIRSCDTCKSMKNMRLEERLKSAFPDAQIQIKCQSYCGPGARTPFAMIDDEIFEAPTIDALIDAIHQYLK